MDNYINDDAINIKVNVDTAGLGKAASALDELKGISDIANGKLVNVLQTINDALKSITEKSVVKLTVDLAPLRELKETLLTIPRDIAIGVRVSPEIATNVKKIAKRTAQSVEEKTKKLNVTKKPINDTEYEDSLKEWQTKRNDIYSKYLTQTKSNKTKTKASDFNEVVDAIVDNIQTYPQNNLDIDLVKSLIKGAKLGKKPVKKIDESTPDFEDYLKYSKIDNMSGSYKTNQKMFDTSVERILEGKELLQKQEEKFGEFIYHYLESKGYNFDAEQPKAVEEVIDNVDEINASNGIYININVDEARLNAIIEELNKLRESSEIDVVIGTVRSPDNNYIEELKKEIDLFDGKVKTEVEFDYEEPFSDNVYNVPTPQTPSSDNTYDVVVNVIRDAFDKFVEEIQSGESLNITASGIDEIAKSIEALNDTEITAKVTLGGSTESDIQDIISKIKEETITIPVKFSDASIRKDITWLNETPKKVPIEFFEANNGMNYLKHKFDELKAHCGEIPIDSTKLETIINKLEGGFNDISVSFADSPVDEFYNKIRELSKVLKDIEIDINVEKAIANISALKDKLNAGNEPLESFIPEDSFKLLDEIKSKLDKRTKGGKALSGEKDIAGFLKRYDSDDIYLSDIITGNKGAPAVSEIYDKVEQLRSIYTDSLSKFNSQDVGFKDIVIKVILENYNDVKSNLDSLKRVSASLIKEKEIPFKVIIPTEDLNKLKAKVDSFRIPLDIPFKLSFPENELTEFRTKALDVKNSLSNIVVGVDTKAASRKIKNINNVIEGTYGRRKSINSFMTESDKSLFADVKNLLDLKFDDSKKLFDTKNLTKFMELYEELDTVHVKARPGDSGFDVLFDSLETRYKELHDEYENQETKRGGFHDVSFEISITGTEKVIEHIKEIQAELDTVNVNAKVIPIDLSLSNDVLDSIYDKVRLHFENNPIKVMFDAVGDTVKAVNVKTLKPVTDVDIPQDVWDKAMKNAEKKQTKKLAQSIADEIYMEKYRDEISTNKAQTKAKNKIAKNKAEIEVSNSGLGIEEAFTSVKNSKTRKREHDYVKSMFDKYPMMQGFEDAANAFQKVVADQSKPQKAIGDMVNPYISNLPYINASVGITRLGHSKERAAPPNTRDTIDAKMDLEARKRQMKLPLKDIKRGDEFQSLFMTLIDPTDIWRESIEQRIQKFTAAKDTLPQGELQEWMIDTINAGVAGAYDRLYRFDNMDTKWSLNEKYFEQGDINGILDGLEATLKSYNTGIKQWAKDISDKLKEFNVSGTGEIDKYLKDIQKSINGYVQTGDNSLKLRTEHLINQANIDESYKKNVSNIVRTSRDGTEYVPHTWVNEFDLKTFSQDFSMKPDEPEQAVFDSKYAVYKQAFEDIRVKFGDASEITKEAAEYLENILKLGPSFGGGERLKQLYKRTILKDEQEPQTVDDNPKFKDYVRSAFGRFLTGAVSGIIGKISGALSSISNKLMSLIGGTIKKSIMLAITPFKKSVQLFSNAIKTAGGKSKVLGSLSELFLMPLVLAVEFTLLPVIKKMIPAIKETINWVVSSKDRFEEIGKVIGVVVNKIYAMLTGNFVYAFENMFKKVEQYSKWIDDEYNKTGDTFFGKVTEIGGSLSSLATSMDAVKTAVGYVNEDLMSLATTKEFGDIGNAIVDNLVTAIGTSIRTSLMTAANMEKNESFNLGKILANILTQAIQAIEISTDMVADILEKITSALANAFSDTSYLDKISGHIQNIIKGVMTIVSQVVSQPWFRDIVFTIIGETKDIWGPILAGQTLLKGVESGANAYIGAKVSGKGKAPTTGGTVAAGAASGAATSKVLSKAAEKAEAAKIAKTLQTPASKAAQTTSSVGGKVGLKSISKLLGPIGLAIEGITSVVDYADNMNYLNSIDTSSTTFKELWDKLSDNALSPVDWAGKLGLELQTIQPILKNTHFTREDIDNMTLDEISKLINTIDAGVKILKESDEVGVINYEDMIKNKDLESIINPINGIEAGVESISQEKSSVDINITNTFNIDKSGNVTEKSVVSPFRGMLNILNTKNIFGA